MQPPLSYPGGKTRLTKTLLAHTPKHEIFVEPMVGGGSYSFAKQPVRKQVMNDINPQIANFYMNIKKTSKKDMEKCNYGTREHFDKIKKSELSKTPSKNVCQMLFLNKCSFGAQNTAWHKHCDYLKNRGLTKVLRNFDDYKKMLSKTIVLNQDFENVIKKYDSPNTFFYLDPPYVKVGEKLYKYGKFDHERLKSVLDGIKGKFILSYNNVPEIRKMYKGFHIKKVKFPYTLNRGQYKEKTELIIANYNLNDKDLGNPSPDSYKHREGVTISELSESDTLTDLVGIGLFTLGVGNLVNDRPIPGAVGIIAGLALWIANK